MFWLQQTRQQMLIFLTAPIQLYVNILRQELYGTKAYELQHLTEERSVVNDHIYHSATEFAVSVKESQDKLPMLYCPDSMTTLAQR